MDPYFDELAGVVGAFVILTNGATAIFYGAGLRRLQDGMGKAAKYAGTLEIILGACMVSLIFAPISLAIFPITMILEILILNSLKLLIVKQPEKLGILIFKLMNLRMGLKQSMSEVGIFHVLLEKLTVKQRYC